MKKLIALLILGFGAVCTYKSLKALAEAKKQAAEAAAEADIEDEEADEDVEDQERIDEDLLKDQGKFRSGVAGIAVIFLFHSFSYVFHDLPSFLNRYCP